MSEKKKKQTNDRNTVKMTKKFARKSTDLGFIEIVIQVLNVQPENFWAKP